MCACVLFVICVIRVFYIGATCACVLFGTCVLRVTCYYMCVLCSEGVEQLSRIFPPILCLQGAKYSDVRQVQISWQTKALPPPGNVA